MKKFLLYLTIAFFFLASCKKEKSEKPPVSSGKKFAVNFAVSNFTQITTNSTAGNATEKTTDAVTINDLSGVASVLYYLIYNSSGNLVREIKQTSTVSNFGNIADSLATGSYTVIFAAGQTGFTAYQESEPLNSHFAPFALLTYNTNTFSVANPQFIYKPWQDSFYKKLTLNVSSGNVNQAVSLDRIVGKVEIVLNDAIPATAKTLQVTFNNEYSVYSLYNNVPDSITNNSSQYSYVVSNTIPASAIGTTNYTVSTIIANTLKPMVVNIKCLDASKTVIAQVTVNNVTCQKNTATILSGSLFGVNNAFQIGIDPSWDPTPIVINY